jgi:hypothetical protein
MNKAIICVPASAGIIVAVLTSAAADCGARMAKPSAGGGTPATLTDRTWVKIAHPIYVAVQERGVFRLKLNSNFLEPLGIHVNTIFDDFKLSPSGRFLLYELAGVSTETFYIYDLHAGIEHQIDSPPRYSHITASPNDRWLAAIPRPGEPPVVWLFDLRASTIKHLPVPVENAMLFASAWSTESHLLFGARNKSGEMFWSVDPETGSFSQLRGVRRTPTEITYLQGSTEIQTVCEWCSAHHDLSTASVAGGTVSVTGDSLTLHRQGAPDRTIASVVSLPTSAPGSPLLACGPEGVRLAGVFDNRYLLFSVDQAVELYGVEEDMIAPLPIPPDALIAWQ